MTSFEVFAAAKLAVVAVGDVTIAGFVANLLKDLTEKGQSYPLDITVPQNDLSEASVTAIADPAAPITMTIALVPAKPIATTASSTATTKSLCWKYVPSKPTMNPEEEDYEESEDTDENLVGKRNDAAPNVFGRKVRPAPSDTYINTEKGKIFTPGYYKPESIKTGPGTAAGNINQMNDILHFDEIQKCEDPSVSDNWAETYKKWIEDFLKARQTELMFMVTNLNLAVLKSGDLMKDGEETAESIGHKQLMDIYGAKLWEWDVNTLLDYSPEALANLPPGAFPIERRIEIHCSCQDGKKAVLSGGGLVEKV
ncbi:hypothetical protein M7I_0829 [Glarea lozoyensis 74030]|uniref:Uncharacterized protein n=1 Tax=Glarea lozoyensis (strain ATCC 74030 / MF5533) TaxID=1104152 RepID=H0EEF4_GLAL7|nr:hypothetical protein M7I_0829 [Glarea lozoyensis 74030]